MIHNDDCYVYYLRSALLLHTHCAGVSRRDEKMYPSITGFAMDMEDKCLIKQILESFPRLTADGWQARAWNRYDAFTEFCNERGMKNLGQDLHE